MNNAVIAVSVCLCGGLGAAARYVCDSVIKASWHKAFPLSTFVINSIAGFLAGVIAGLYSRRFLSDPAHVMLATGFLGGFSTFSTMMNESVTLLRGGRITVFVGYVLDIALSSETGARTLTRGVVSLSLGMDGLWITATRIG